MVCLTNMILEQTVLTAHFQKRREYMMTFCQYWTVCLNWTCFTNDHMLPSKFHHTPLSHFPRIMYYLRNNEHGRNQKADLRKLYFYIQILCYPLPKIDIWNYYKYAFCVKIKELLDTITRRWRWLTLTEVDAEYWWLCYCMFSRPCRRTHFSQRWI